MNTDTNSKQGSDQNLFGLIISRYLPYWPLFAVLAVLGILGAWGYLKWATPIYETSATLIIKDEKKGVDDPNVMESMNVFDSKKIVENEIEVISSRSLMSEVANDLALYAPTFEDGSLKSRSAYTTSPVKIELREPNKIPLIYEGKPKKYYFSFDANSKQVRFGGKSYAVDTWITDLPMGDIRFLLNERQFGEPKDLLYFTLTNPKVVTMELLDDLKVKSTNKLSTIISLSYKDAVPERGEDVLNGLIISYNQKAVSDRNALAANTLKFIEDRMQKVGDELADLEKEIQEYRATKGVVDLSEQGRLYLKDMGDYDRQIGDINRQLQVLNEVESYVVSKKNEGGLVPSTLGVNDPVLARLLEKLYEAEIKYARLKKTTAENNPILVSIRNEIEKIRPSILENIRNQQSNLNASLGSLSYNSGKSSTAFKNIPEQERNLLEITRRKGIKSNLFLFLQQKREEAALTYAPNSGDSRLVDAAESSLLPVSPKSLFAYLAGLALAVTIGILFVIFKERFNNKVLFRSEIEENTNLPVVAEFSHLKNKNEKAHPVLSYDLGVLEQFRQLCAKLGLYRRKSDKKKILVTSSISGEGKSFISSNLANSLALSGKKVVLLDMDLRKPNTTNLYNLAAENGLIDYLKGEAKFNNILHPSKENDLLQIIPAGTKGGYHSKLLLNGRMEILFDYLTDNFDYIVIDSAPLDLVSEVNFLSEFCDKTLFVVRHGHTPKRIIQRLRQSAKLAPFNDVGIVFNGVKKRGMIKGDYGYGYGIEYDYNIPYGSRM